MLADRLASAIRCAGPLLDGERQVLAEVIELVAEVRPCLPGATRWDLRRIGDSAGDRLLGQYLRKIAGELP